ncbi:MAG: hypothetical protein ACHQU1_06875, partial [Gemmatimonadales bacterium]
IPAPRGMGRRTTPTSFGAGAVDQPRGGTVDQPRGIGDRPTTGRDVTRPDVGRNPVPPPGEPTGRRESPGIEIVPRQSQPGDAGGARETPKTPDGQPRGFTPGQAKPSDAPRPGDGWYGRRQPEDARPTRPDQARPQGREMPPARAPEAARPSSPPPRAAPPQAREAPRAAPSQPRAAPQQAPQRGSNPQLTRRRP